MQRQKQLYKNNMKNLLPFLNPKSHILEQYHTIRANLQPTLNQNYIKTLVITSSEEMEGKSTVAINLAIAFAEVGKKVLLVDADFRKPSIHHSFRSNNYKGFSNVLLNDVALHSCILISEISNLDILTSGETPSKPSELLGSKAMEMFITYTKTYYDLVIFDSPSVLSVADPLILSNICDGILMVVRSNMNGSETIESTRDILLKTNAKFLGAVLNDERIEKRQRKKHKKRLQRA